MKDFDKFFETKESMLNVLQKFPFINLSEDKETASYVISDDFAVISILNIPQKMNKSEIIKEFSLENAPSYKLYKKSLFWVITTDSKELIQILENKLKNCEFDDTKLKYDLVNKEELLKSIHKQISIYNYQKDANNLKANYSSNNSNKGNNQSSRTNSDAFSWRRNSNVNNTLISSSGGKTKPENEFKRERFNSEGNSGFNPNNKAFFGKNKNTVEEIEIDISNIKYSLTIKHKYSPIEVLNLYDKYLSSGILNKQPSFNVHIDEILNQDKKKIKLNKGRDRANTTFTYEAKKQYGFENYNSEESINNNSNYYDNYNKNFKIPKNNPLAKIGKAQYNKFDEVNVQKLN